MNTIDCIKSRRSVRKFKDEQIKDDKLIKVLEAGT
jgi:nitroreductase